MAIKKWQKFKDQVRRTKWSPLENKKLTQKLVPQKPKPISTLIGDIRKGLDPNELVGHIKQISTRGNKSHIKLFELLLKKYPEVKSSPYPYYNEIRKALLAGIEKLKIK